MRKGSCRITSPNLSFYLSRSPSVHAVERTSFPPDRLGEGDLLKDQQRSLTLVAYSSYHFIYLCSCSLYVIYMYNFSCILSSVSFVQCSKASSVVASLTGLLSWAWDLRASDYTISEGVPSDPRGDKVYDVRKGRRDRYRSN